MDTYLWRAVHVSLTMILVVAVLGYLSRQLQKSRTQLLATARQAGMAEIATNVLHNVGNVLNSVNVSAGLINIRLRNSKLKGLARAVHLMDEHGDDLGEFLAHDARGKLLPSYLRELAPALELEQDGMAAELDALCNSVDHIKEVIAAQQSHAGKPRFMEPVRLGELVDDALRMNASALTRHKVEIVKDLAELPVLPLDRNRLLQILVNLIDNAKQALRDAPGRTPRVTLSAALTPKRALRIAVADNGEGIAQENLTRVFSHGFTTRKNGHGFGLHSCVLAAQEMGGSLTVHSAGVGQGAEFTLEIPIDAAQC
jgi:signal transduction histidine kinase